MSQINNSSLLSLSLMIFFGLSDITFKVYLHVASGESLAGTSGAVHM
jgi:hypothetical protein